ncbi:hypothetical protein [Ciceribacter sp. T2.26MG-112.2]|uniref:hypothetical protein n=1 Tax=Ciceribacter sp. T2.26MG-112.2 TaxID=3137154 RepID=UPI0012B6AAB2|nr:hypothetical protein [Ciceribacter naphthalenivorans]
MKALFFALPMVIIATSVHAVPKYTSTRMNCEAVQATVREHGRVILTYPSQRLKGQRLYDTYVANGHFCRPGEIIRMATVPSADRPNCPVRQCEPNDTEHEPYGRDQSPNDPAY